MEKDITRNDAFQKNAFPTGIGKEFDAFIQALATLEADAAKRGLKGIDVIAAIRKLLMDKRVPSPLSGKLDLDRILPGTANVVSPPEWLTDPTLSQAAGTIRKSASLRIGYRIVNISYLLTCLEARFSKPEITSPDARLKLGSSLELVSFQGTLAQAIFQFAQKATIPTLPGAPPPKLNPALLDTFYAQYSGTDKITAFVDVLSMSYNPQDTISNNLLNYYTNTKGAISNSYNSFAKRIGLGNYKDGGFDNNNADFRSKQVNNILGASMLYNLDSGRQKDVDVMLREGTKNPVYATYAASADYMYTKFVDVISTGASMEFHVPAVLSWNRLEPRPRTNNFKRVLRAEMRDALWILSRQWQMGEFAAEDAGTPVEMRVDMQTSHVGKFSLHKNPAKTLTNQQPLETIVEREIVQPDLTLRLEMGKHWLRLLEAKLAADPTPIAPATIAAVVKGFKTNASLHFVLPAPNTAFPEIYSDNSMLHWYAALANGRAIDGNTLYKALKAGTTADSFITSPSPAITALVNSTATEFVQWFESIYSQPAVATDSAWNASQLEYQFHTSAPDSTSAVTVLTADEYASGHLDWYNFDIETKSSNYDAGLLTGYTPDMINRKVITVLPGDLQFPGMPNKRWWKFEDYKVDLGGIKPDTTEPAKLLLAEFALIYSNDWMLLPFAVDAGNICSTQSITVKDVFGQYTSIQPAGAGDSTDWQRWTMFNLFRRNYGGGIADTRLFIPPSTIKVMESDPLESVSLMRDEMANLVWGIENIIPNGKGIGIEGWDAARRLLKYLQSITIAPPVAPPANNNAAVEYELGTTVPENWIPFIPQRIDSVTSREIQLRRAAMPRIIPGRTIERVRPRTELLRTGYNPATNTWGAYTIFEEEVPRSGAIVERTWQRTRWLDGSVITWLGRRKYTGRGEADSGLEFDTVKDKEV